MSEKKPPPLIRVVTPKRCPVCGHASYSANGIHPQCNGALADEKRRALRAAEKRAEASPPADNELPPAGS